MVAEKRKINQYHKNPPKPPHTVLQPKRTRPSPEQSIPSGVFKYQQQDFQVLPVKSEPVTLPHVRVQEQVWWSMRRTMKSMEIMNSLMGWERSAIQIYCLHFIWKGCHLSFLPFGTVTFICYVYFRIGGTDGTLIRCMRIPSPGSADSVKNVLSRSVM